jgi:hypothetical protein
MDDPERKDESSDDDEDMEGRLLPSGFFEIFGESYESRKRQKDEGKGGDNPPPTPPAPPIPPPTPPDESAYQRWWGGLTKDRRIELGLAAAIVFLALAQLIVLISNNNSTTQQADRLIDAARYGAYASDRNAQAAQSFAGSAQKINQGINNAADRLGAQALANQQAADAATWALEQNQRQFEIISASNEERFNRTLNQMMAQTTAQQGAVSASNAATDRSIKESERILAAQNRPWIGVTILRVEPEEFTNPESKWPHIRFNIHYALHNYGSSPAVRIASAFGPMRDLDLVAATLTKMSCATDDVKNEKKFPSLPGIFPGGTEPNSSDGLIYTPPASLYGGSGYSDTVWGCITYVGPDRDVHVTSIRVGITTKESDTTKGSTPKITAAFTVRYDTAD